MALLRNVACILVAAVFACARFDSGRPFDGSKADDIKIGKTPKVDNLIFTLGHQSEYGTTHRNF